jgi:nitroreductase
MMPDYTRSGMEVGRAIQTQRAIRRFSDRPVDPDAVDAILDAGRRAPSSNNEQRWAFVVVTDRDRLAELAAIGDYADHLAGAAAAIAIVVPQGTEDWEDASIAFDAGQCAQNIMLRAWDLGIGSVHAAVYDEELTRRLLGYPDGWRCDYVLSLGFPAEPPTAQGARTPIDELVHRDRW